MREFTVQELMELNEATLAEMQYDALKKHTLGVLNNVYNLITDEKFEDVRKLLEYSPSGDGYGYDNYYINFGYVKSDQHSDTRDISDMLDELQRLKNKIEE